MTQVLDPFQPMRPELRRRLFAEYRVSGGQLEAKEGRIAPTFRPELSGIMVALLPAGPLDWAKQDLPHMTIVYGGSDAETGPDRTRLEELCSEVADNYGPIYVPVTGTDVFGDEEAVDVITLEVTPELEVLRGLFVWANRSQYADFKPHATIGPTGSKDPETIPPTLRFDRILLCYGADKVTWFLHGTDPGGVLEGRAATGGQFAKGGGRVPGRGALSQSDLDDFATPFGASAAAHLEPDGAGGMRFTAERAALHEKLIQEQLAGVQKSADPTTTILGGGPGSGKTTSAGQAGIPEAKEKKNVWADPDKMKEGLPEYDPKNPGPVHEESSYLAKQVALRAQGAGHDVVIDGVADNVDSISSKIASARAAGHKVNGNFTTTSIDLAQVRNQKRTRTVDPTLLAEKHAKVSKNFTKISELDFNEVTLSENNWTKANPAPLKLVATKRARGSLTITDEGAWASFQSKANDTRRWTDEGVEITS